MALRFIVNNMTKALMDLQEQATNLMLHEWYDDAQDVVFYVGATRIVPPSLHVELDRATNRNGVGDQLFLLRLLLGRKSELRFRRVCLLSSRSQT